MQHTSNTYFTSYIVKEYIENIQSCIKYGYFLEYVVIRLELAS